MQLFSRLSAFVLVLLSSLALLSCASPIVAPAVRDVALPEHGLVARGGTCSLDCTTGTDTVNILVKLQADVNVQLGHLDECLDNKTDPTEVILKIVALINVAVEAILKLKVDLTGLLNLKITVIVNLLVSILVGIATHCGKWVDKGAALHIKLEVFLALCAKLDVALKALLSTCNGLGAVLLVLIKVLINVTILVKVKFNLCIGILGL
ncbi:hypothetical protein FRC08_001648 [Ceratobasidium sp. 394]|nr:hypothetical protein FRC08_001648 [Ceratobasidium sp. 394]KAG9098807.1 hypothetical protein FS749_002914 [Ceratobasidium sp. UAMH 11750]